MVQAHALGLMARVEDSSVVLSRGYYYGTGAGGQARIAWRSPRWTAQVESVAQHFWSFDDHAHGGGGDPKHLEDWRVTSRAALDLRPFHNDVALEAYATHAVREGTSSDAYRVSSELAAGFAAVFGF